MTVPATGGRSSRDRRSPRCATRTRAPRSPSARHGAATRLLRPRAVIRATRRAAGRRPRSGSPAGRSRSIAPKGPTRGSAKMYVDGVYVSTVSLYRSRFAPRIVVAARSWSSSGAHTVKLVLVGTARPPALRRRRLHDPEVASRPAAGRCPALAPAVGRHRERRQQQRDVVAPLRCRSRAGPRSGVGRTGPRRPVRRARRHRVRG